MQNVTGLADVVMSVFGNRENGTRVKSSGSNFAGVYADSAVRVLAGV